MSDNPLLNVSAASLRRALEIREEIESLQGELEALLSGEGAPRAKRKYTRKATKKGATKKSGAKKKREFSPEARAKMAEAMRRRWAVKKAKSKKGKKDKGK